MPSPDIDPAASAAYRALIPIAAPLIEQHGVKPMIDALLELYAQLALQLGGVGSTQAHLVEAAQALPGMAAKMRAGGAQVPEPPTPATAAQLGHMPLAIYPQLLSQAIVRLQVAIAGGLDDELRGRVIAALQQPGQLAAVRLSSLKAGEIGIHLEPSGFCDELVAALPPLPTVAEAGRA